MLPGKLLKNKVFFEIPKFFCNKKIRLRGFVKRFLKRNCRQKSHTQGMSQEQFREMTKPKLRHPITKKGSLGSEHPFAYRLPSKILFNLFQQTSLAR